MCINKEKSFVSLGYFIEITTFKRLYHMFNDIGKVSVALHNSYTYVAGISSSDNITVVDANNNPTSILQDKFNNHRFYTTLKTQLDYNNWFYSLSVNYHNRKNKNQYGGNLAVGYKF
jgi:nucleoside-specific outer membrane channel protein Tsx